MKCSPRETNRPDTTDSSSNSYKSELQQDLENPKNRPWWAVWLDRLGDIFASLFKKSCEIQIWRSTDQHGQLWWHAYNSRTQQSGVFDSESEVRAWLERQYHI